MALHKSHYILPLYYLQLLKILLAIFLVELVQFHLSILVLLCFQLYYFFQLLSHHIHNLSYIHHIFLLALAMDQMAYSHIQVLKIENLHYFVFLLLDMIYTIYQLHFVFQINFAYIDANIDFHLYYIPQIFANIMYSDLHLCIFLQQNFLRHLQIQLQYSILQLLLYLKHLNIFYMMDLKILLLLLC